MEALRCLKFLFHDYRGGHRELAVRPNEKMGGGKRGVGREIWHGVKLRLIQAPMRLNFHFGDQILKISRQIGD